MVWRGAVPYREALAAQRRHREAMVDEGAGEEVWAMEHPAVLTTGRRDVQGLPPEAWLREQGVERVHSERGGLATYHGPGQLVLYFLLDLKSRGLGVKDFIGALEHGVITWLASIGVRATTDPRGRGVWVQGEKICAVGIHVRKGVTMHGLALNLKMDLHPFSWFSPCGIAAKTTDVQAHVDAVGGPEEVWEEVCVRVLEKLIDRPMPVG